MSDFENSNKIDLEEIKAQISQVSQKPLDTHPQEFENIHSDLVQALSEIDGL
jgi:23S rRNA (cytidine1920-2'-O)/16S rRNA (cytidine1409-2'-O)-methyltransferase